MNDFIKVPVSLGELWDKYTILIIKKKKITNPNKLKHVYKEIEQLEPIIRTCPIEEVYYNDLLTINHQLWDIEDAIREKEKKMEFDDTFIDIARSVYKKNDERARIKSEINKVYNSFMVEVKDYN